MKMSSIFRGFFVLREGEGGEGGTGGTGTGGTGTGGAGDEGGAGGAGEGGEGGAAVANPYVNETGQFTENWMDGLSDEFEPMKPTLGRYRSVEEMSKSLYHTKQLLGKKADAVVIPGEESSDVERAEFRKALNVPESIEGYGLKQPADMPEGMGFSEEHLNGFLELAHKHNISTQGAEELMAFHMGVEANALESLTADTDAFIAQQQEILQNEWGGGFEKNLADAQLGARDLGVNLDDAHPVFNEAWFIQAMLRHGKAVGEDSMKRGETEIHGAGANKLKAQDIMNNPNNSLYQKYQDKDEKTIARVRALLQS